MMQKGVLFAVPLLAAGTASAAAQRTVSHRAARPNVILIVADDLGYGDLSCYGARRVHTPHVDALARSGLRFTAAHACASTSTPARYGLLTGEYPFRREGTDVAAGNAGMIIRPEQYTMADMFRAAGYRTAAIGKWHLGLGSQTGAQDWNGELDVHLRDIGFDYSYIMAATADRVPCVFIENGRVANYDPTAPIEVSYQRNFPGEPTGRDNPELLTKMRSSHGHDQSIVNGIGRIGYMRGGGKALWRDEDIADSITTRACQFITEAAGRRQPFFLYLCTNDIHVPRYPANRFRGNSPLGVRGDVVAQFDWTVCEVLATLRGADIEGETLVILTSDNGPVLDDGYADRAEELAGDHLPGGPFRGGKYSAYEAGTAVPLIVCWPGHVKAGRESHALFTQTDLFRSLARLTGVRLPGNAAPDSRELLPTLLGRSRKPAPYVLTMPNNRSVNLRTQQWKYIAPSDGPAIVPWGTRIETGYRTHPQLFNLQTSRYETDNQADRHPRLVRKFQRIIDRERGKR